MEMALVKGLISSIVLYLGFSGLLLNIPEKIQREMDSMMKSLIAVNAISVMACFIGICSKFCITGEETSLDSMIGILLLPYILNAVFAMYVYLFKVRKGSMPQI